MNDLVLENKGSPNIVGVWLECILIWHDHVSAVEFSAAKKREFLYRAMTCISAKFEKCSHIQEAASPMMLHLFEAVLKKEIPLIRETALVQNYSPLLIV